MSCAASSWRLYPKRSITSHRFCGSERLFPGLETRRAEIMTELVVAKDTSNPEHAQEYFTCIPMSSIFPQQ